MLTFASSARQLLIGFALAAPALQAQQTPAAPATPSAAAAQTPQPQCILAGRLNPEGRWAPQASGMQLLDAAGKPVSGAAQNTLASVKAVLLAEPALLSACNAGQAMASGDTSSGSKSPTPALTAGNVPIEVLAMATLPGRAGGQWVELRVSVPAERILMLTR